MTDDGESEAVEALQRLGLSKYEAQVFIALERLGAGTARDVDRMTDVPRSQVYGAAENLEERGLVEVQQSNPIQYRAVPLDEARETLTERFEREQARAFDYLETARRGEDYKDEHQEGVWTVHGRDNVSARVRQIVADAREHVLYASGPELVDEEVAAALRERAEEVDVWVCSEFSDDPAITEQFADSAVTVAPFPEDPTADAAGRLLAVDGETVLLSVLGGEELPGVRTETAIWSSDTGIATVLLQLLRSHLDDDIEAKL
ncbi:TrmB family transcriptional regulator [Halosimplex aquaticum]|uniref:TrmB family transcriptional regulator n=1 Tax=Halosimplex aquaticum TaxID=3026162 RepID=A0ABD5XUZ0_9EURY|nr:helix-turn-helix domain-containing protein [Halosimplex aquaticum]